MYIYSCKFRLGPYNDLLQTRKVQVHYLRQQREQLFFQLRSFKILLVLLELNFLHKS